MQFISYCFGGKSISKCHQPESVFSNKLGFRTPSPRVSKNKKPPSIYEERRQKIIEIQNQQKKLQSELYTELRISEN